MRAEVLGVLTLTVSAVSFNVMEVSPLKGLGVGFELPGIASHDDLPTKSRYVLLGVGEHVKVPDPPPKIEQLRTQHHFADFRFGNGWSAGVWPLPTQRIAFRSEQPGPGRDSSGIEIETDWKRGRSQFPINVEPKISGWGVAGIFPNWPKSPDVFPLFLSRFEKGPETGSEYECPLVSNEGPFSDAGGVLRCFGSASGVKQGRNNENYSNKANFKLEQSDVNSILGGAGRPDLRSQAIVGASLGVAAVALGYLLYFCAAISYPLDCPPSVQTRNDNSRRNNRAR